MSTATLIKNLQNKTLYDYAIDSFTVLETHCSYVILTGKYAYKLKKAVDFGFLDYSDLNKRKHFCEEEVARNQGLAGDIYLTTLPIYGTPDAPSLNGTGDVIEYMVKMHEFPQQNLLSKLQQENKLSTSIIDKLADNLAQFHLATKAVANDNIIGSSRHAHQQTLDNFSQTRPLLTDAADINELDHVQRLAEQQFQRIKTIIDQRKQTGFVKECHGDVHLNNIVLINDNPVIFDCIDFNDDFCWTDTMADLAFITMDLDEFGEHHYSWQLLNRYLEITGDYDGLNVLGYFQSYRAMVRAKVAMFTLVNCDDTAEKHRQYSRYQGCLELAAQYLQPRPRQLVITCGVSASGKSTLAKACSTAADMIYICSDRERKRIANIALKQDCTAEVLAGIYAPSHTEKTYQALLELAKTCLQAGYPVIIDATFCQQQYRQLFASLAAELNINFTILYCNAPEKTLRQWLSARTQADEKISEATQDVLTMQLQQFENPLLTEATQTLEVDTTKPESFVTIQQQLNATR